MKQSKRQLEIEARRAADPIAQAVGRDDIDYSSDELPTAPRQTATDIDPISASCAGNVEDVRHVGCVYQGCRCLCHEKIVTLLEPSAEAKYPTQMLDGLLAAGEINREQHERLQRENK